MLKSCVKMIAGLLLCAVPVAGSAALKGDVNGDGRIGHDDVGIMTDALRDNWMKYFPEYDTNGDGRFSISDICHTLYRVTHPGGLDVGIGGWEEDDEDLGGVVSAPVRPRAAMQGCTIMVPDVIARPGFDFYIDINLTNPIDILGMQFAVNLPVGLEFIMDGNRCRVDKMRWWEWPDCNEEAGEGRHRHWIYYSIDQWPLVGDSGTVVRVFCHVPDDTPEGEYTVTVSGLEFGESQFKGIVPGDIEVNVSVRDFIPGDVNSDGVVTVTDIVAVVDHIMENNPANFNFVAADVNSDNNVTVSDIVGIVEIIMSKL